MLLDGKVAYVSGAAGSIGTAIARRLCEQGARVVAGDLDLRLVEELCAELRGEGHDALAVRHDVTSRSETAAVLTAVLSAHGRVDIACANAGVGCNVPVLELDDATWQHVLAVNTTGVLLTLQAFGAQMVQQRSGALVVTASISSLRGAHSMGAYCASKFAVMGLVESLAKEVGEFGVRVNCVNPGPVEGGLARAMIRETAETQGKSEQDSYDELTAPIALGRLVEPVEVADAVVFLASPLSGFVTGQRLVVDGGMLAK
jgi:NAD(P)-dependent dehydrogenase (short-subunit alcohol dehydrogenase family)